MTTTPHRRYNLLYSLNSLALVIKEPSKIVYINQTGGNENHQDQVKGTLVLLGMSDTHGDSMIEQLTRIMSEHETIDGTAAAINRLFAEGTQEEQSPVFPLFGLIVVFWDRPFRRP